MGANLIEQLGQVKDFRVKDGQRHQLWMVSSWTKINKTV